MALYQAAQLFELLPQAANDLWQADVTYLHIPGHGGWYAVTVIDCNLRYLLVCHFILSYTARDVAFALYLARAKPSASTCRWRRTRFWSPTTARVSLPGIFKRHIEDRFAQVRIQYRTPTQLGLLKRFHQTLKTEEAYWEPYTSRGKARESPQAFRRRFNEIRPHWALVPTGSGDVLTPAEVYVHGQATELPNWQGWAKAAREKLKELAQGAQWLPDAGLHSHKIRSDVSS